MTEEGPSDEQLSAELKKWTGASPALHPVGELLDRHWAAALAYARLCTDGPRAAGMLTTAAFTRLFGASLRQNGPSAAWRPQLLVAVRQIAAEWDGDGRREHLHPALRTGTGAGERAAARLLPPPGRRLLSRAFQRVPEMSRAVLWHAEVEAEPLAVPAALLGLDEEDARVELRRARERLREECLQAHREFAPENECRRYLRMLDVTFRRGGTEIDPDLREHLAGCSHCGRTAEQLARFNDGLGLALAEAVLGWGALGYLESRADRAEESAEPAPAGPGAPADRNAAAPRGGDAGAPPAGEAFVPVASAAPDGGAAPRPAGGGGPGRRRAGASPGAAEGIEPAPASRRSPQRAESASRHPEQRAEPATRRSAQRAARRARRRNLALAIGTVGGLVVLPLVLWSVLGSGGTPASGAAGRPSRTPGKDAASPGGSWAGAPTETQGALRGRLNNTASGLCVDVVGEKAVQGAETELTACSADATQQWTYETDGLLRSAAAPDLCLDSHLGYSVRLAPCAATGRAARDIHYDFTLQGALVPRWNQELALTPAATDGSGALVLKTRAAGTAQRWSVDAAHADLRMENVNWDGDSTPVPAGGAPGGTASEPTAPAPSVPPKASAAPAPTAPAPSPTVTADPCTEHPEYCGWGGGRHRHRH
ncbi:RICIN domain-containing protein [Streptomyces sp. Caat 7-52]|uniref:RICIN domain-containing protein n=1 Tax=Streptomyces sp. Caat 7-52 TaxID=2949637 RepID=UPI002035797F|nr:RICIN domain-containing protein [Streptomyces sp. Caat 7-52]